MICQGCGRTFEGRRDARFCGDSCRYEAWDRAHPRTTREGAGQPYNGNVRRPSRNGTGTRIYVTPADTEDEILDKARAALERLL